MKKLLVIASILTALVWVAPALAADVTLEWDAAKGATGYELSYSTDNGANWSTPIDVGNVTTYIMTGVPETGLVIVKVGAYNDAGQRTYREWAGAWYNHLWKPAEEPGRIGIP
jgi:hypothetical protein